MADFLDRCTTLELFNLNFRDLPTDGFTVLRLRICTSKLHLNCYPRNRIKCCLPATCIHWKQKRKLSSRIKIKNKIPRLLSPKQNCTSIAIPETELKAVFRYIKNKIPRSLSQKQKMSRLLELDLGVFEALSVKHLLQSAT